MKRYTYPAVFYYDEEYNDYAVEFSDICIYAEGETMEEAYKNAQDYLVAYLDCCVELNVSPNPPNTYESTLKDHPNGKIMLVTVEYEAKKSDSDTEEKAKETYTNLNEDILVDSDEEYDEKMVLKEIENLQAQREKVLSEKKDDDGDGDDDFSLPEVD